MTQACDPFDRTDHVWALSQKPPRKSREPRLLNRRHAIRCVCFKMREIIEHRDYNSNSRGPSDQSPGPSASNCSLGRPATRRSSTNIGAMVAEHPRSFGRGETIYDPWSLCPRARPQAWYLAQPRALQGLGAAGRDGPCGAGSPALTTAIGRWSTFSPRC